MLGWPVGMSMGIVLIEVGGPTYSEWTLEKVS